MKRIEKIPATYVEQVQERSIKRVAIYARVSTMYDAQNNSYEAQVSYELDHTGYKGSDLFSIIYFSVLDCTPSQFNYKQIMISKCNYPFQSANFAL